MTEITQPSSQVYPQTDDGKCGADGFVWFWGYDGTTPGPTVYVPTNKRHERWGNVANYPFDVRSGDRSFNNAEPKDLENTLDHRAFESQSSAMRDRTPITIMRHWNRLGIDPDVTFDDLKQAAANKKTKSLISG